LMSYNIFLCKIQLWFRSSLKIAFERYTYFNLLLLSVVFRYRLASLCLVKAFDGLESSKSIKVCQVFAVTLQCIGWWFVAVGLSRFQTVLQCGTLLLEHVHCRLLFLERLLQIANETLLDLVELVELHFMLGLPIVMICLEGQVRSLNRLIIHVTVKVTLESGLLVTRIRIGRVHLLVLQVGGPEVSNSFVVLVGVAPDILTWITVLLADATPLVLDSCFSIILPHIIQVVLVLSVLFDIV